MEGYQLDSGIWLEPMPPRKGQEVSIYYSGQLAGRSEEPVYLYVNYSTPSNIEESQRLRMNQEEQILSATFSAEHKERMRFYFRRQDGNIDDNEGEGWEIQLADA